MQSNSINTVTRMRTQAVSRTNSVVRNTYLLLSLTLLFSAAMAFYGTLNPSYVSFGLFFLVSIGLQYLTYALRNSVWGIASTFAFTGFMGYTLGPILNYYLSLAHGPELVTAAIGLTGIIFLSLSAYASITRENFRYLFAFLFAGSIVAMLAALAGIYLQIPALQLAVSAIFVLISAGFILYQTSEIINGGETNYVIATIGLYVQIYNLFLSLLQILSALNNKR